MRNIPSCDPEKAGGFVFRYNSSRKVSGGIPVDWDFLNAETNIRNWGPGEFAMAVLCGECDAFMEYHYGPEEAPLTGRYRCPCCWLGVREISLYNFLERKNEQFLDEF